MIRLRDRMTRLSRLRYLAWRSGLIGDEVEVALFTGERLLLQKSLRLGLSTAYEIFVMDGYRCPREIVPASVRHIVDVGANVGYSLIYWASRFPAACIEAFEPHPRHLQALRRSLQMNGIEARVEVHPVAVGETGGICELVDAGAASTIARHRTAFRSEAFGRIQVEVVDFFGAVKGSQIDLLKLDCEGAEYGILMDQRFADLNVRNLVMEWHATDEHPDAREKLTARLRDLKWEVQPGITEELEVLDGIGLRGAGLLWGFRQ